MIWFTSDQGGSMQDATYLIKDFLYSISGTVGFSAGLAGAIGGLVLLFLGYKLKKAALAISGLMGGYAGGLFLAGRLLEAGTLGFLLLPIVCALAGALLMFAVFKLALFLLGFTAGIVGFFYLGASVVSNPVTGIILAAVSGAVLGALALAAERLVLIILTSFIGYTAFRQGIYSLIDSYNSRIFEIVALAFLVLGIVVQFLLNRGEERTRRDSSERDISASKVREKPEKVKKEKPEKKAKKHKPVKAAKQRDAEKQESTEAPERRPSLLAAAEAMKEEDFAANDLADLDNMSSEIDFADSDDDFGLDDDFDVDFLPED